MNLLQLDLPCYATGGLLAFRRGHSCIDRSGLAPGHYIELSISDSRPTIPAAQLDNIFDPQLEEAERVGTGLSLAMCWNLVEQAGGTILVESQVGSGCTFRLLLPRLEATPAAEAPRASFPAGSAEHCVKVLVVDDEPAIRQLIVRHLHLAGHRTLEASNGVEALAQLETQPDCDLVVSDVLMPLMGGMELAQQIHERHLRPAVLFISGYAPETRSLAEGRDWPLLIKPFTKDALLRGGWQIARQYQERSHRSRRLTALLN